MRWMHGARDLLLAQLLRHTGFLHRWVTVVAPALLAARHGATALHDPTEGGIATALHEVVVANTRAGVSLSWVLMGEPGPALAPSPG